MPQLIAMIIIIVTALIYMFLTFGGTGDKIVSVSKKSVILTEINNIKHGVGIANESGILETSTGTSTLRAHTLEGLATLGYFDSVINEQILNSVDTRNTSGDDTFNVYKAISFNGGKTVTAGDLEISLTPAWGTTIGDKPGIFVKVGGKLADQAGFLESQLAVDLGAVAYIDRTSVNSNDITIFNADGDFEDADGVHGGSITDGMFTIYFKDIKSGKAN